jgi:ribosome biogenesis GTPase
VVKHGTDLAAAVDAAFAEVEAYAADCRFRDCRHATEPGCAVRGAVEAGEIAPERLAAYLELRHEAEAHQRRSAVHLQRQDDRRFSRMVRGFKKLEE